MWPNLILYITSSCFLNLWFLISPSFLWMPKKCQPLCLYPLCPISFQFGIWWNFRSQPCHFAFYLPAHFLPLQYVQQEHHKITTAAGLLHIAQCLCACTVLQSCIKYIDQHVTRLKINDFRNVQYFFNETIIVLNQGFFFCSGCCNLSWEVYIMGCTMKWAKAVGKLSHPLYRHQRVAKHWHWFFV